jgi:hypothetical protein
VGNTERWPRKGKKMKTLAGRGGEERAKNKVVRHDVKKSSG